MLVCGNHCAAAQNFFPHPNVKFASGMKSAAPISSPPISHEPRGCHIVRYGGVLHTKKATPTTSIGSYNGGVRSLDQELNFYPDLASTLQDLSVDTLFASIGQELRKLHFRVTHSEIIWYVIVS